MSGSRDVTLHPRLNGLLHVCRNPFELRKSEWAMNRLVTSSVTVQM